MAQIKPCLLLKEIDRIMGASISCNKQKKLSEKRPTKGLNRNGFNRKYFQSFVNYRDRQLRRISKCLASFDYVIFSENGVTSRVPWNGKNLFLEQGLYFNAEVLPISVLSIESIVLDKNFLADFPVTKY